MRFPGSFYCFGCADVIGDAVQMLRDISVSGNVAVLSAVALFSGQCGVWSNSIRKAGKIRICPYFMLTMRRFCVRAAFELMAGGCGSGTSSVAWIQQK